MGMAWFTYENSLYTIHKGWILVPKYAQDWTKTDRIEVVKAGDYYDFQIVTPAGVKYVNGHVLIGAFEHLYNKEDVTVSFDDCLYDNAHYPYYDHKVIEKLREDGIYSDAGSRKKDFSLIVVKYDDTRAYEDCDSFSPTSQEYFLDKDHPYYNKYMEKRDWNYKSIRQSYQIAWVSYFLP